MFAFSIHNIHYTQIHYIVALNLHYFQMHNFIESKLSITFFLL